MMMVRVREVSKLIGENAVVGRHVCDEREDAFLQQPFLCLFYQFIHVLVLDLVELIVVDHFRHHHCTLPSHLPHYSLHHVLLHAFQQAFTHYLLAQTQHEAHSCNQLIHHLQFPPLGCLFPQSLLRYLPAFVLDYCVELEEKRQLKGVSQVESKGYFGSAGVNGGLVYSLPCDGHKLLLNDPLNDCIVEVLFEHAGLSAFLLVVMTQCHSLHHDSTHFPVDHVGCNQFQHRLGHKIVLQLTGIDLPAYEESPNQCLHLTQPAQSEEFDYLFGIEAVRCRQIDLHG
jgi:hypothetical protein